MLFLVPTPRSSASGPWVSSWELRGERRVGGTAWQVCLAMGCLGSGMTGPDVVEVAILAAVMSLSGKQPLKKKPPACAFSYSCCLPHSCPPGAPCLPLRLPA